MLSPTVKNGLTLAVFAGLCALALSLTHFTTRDRIALAQQRYVEKRLHQIIPEASYTNDLYQSCVKVTRTDALGHLTTHQVYIAKDDREPVALAIETVTHEGYSGDIHLMVGVDINQHILGVRTLQHQETPGLGDKIDEKKSDWVLSFDGLRYAAEDDAAWQVKKDGGRFDQFTGATITPRAYVKSVRDILIYINSHLDTILKNKTSCRG